MFHEFPYVNMHELNLDWIIQKVKEAYSPDNPPEGIVLSVNGEDGNVILYHDAIVRFPDVTEGTWNIHRTAGGSSSGIQFLPNKAQRISGTQRLDMYDAGNPPPYPVKSVNGQTGDVTIQIPVQSVNGQTGVVVIPPDFQSNGEIMEFTQASEGNYWGLSRVVSTGTASIYLDTSNNTVKAYITYESTDGQTVVTLPLLTSADIPSSSGVISINGKTGAVTLYGSDVYTDANSQTTVAQDLAAHGTAIASLQQTQSEDHTNLIQARQNITNLQGRMTTAEGNITAEVSRAEAAEQDLMECMAILINGDQSATGVAAGQYVYLKDSTITGAADGLYKATMAIPANTAIDATYLTAVSGGGFNSLNENIANIGQFKTFNYTVSASSDSTCISNALADILTQMTEGTFIARVMRTGAWLLVCYGAVRGGYAYAECFNTANGTIYIFSKTAGQDVSTIINISENISTVNGRITNLQNSLTRKSISTSISCAANSISSGDISISSAPSSFLIVAGYSIASTTDLLIEQIYITDINTIHYRVRNISSTNQTGTLEINYI